MSDVALQIEHLVRRLAAKKLSELIEDRFQESLAEATQTGLKLFEAAIRSFLASDTLQATVQEVIAEMVVETAKPIILQVVEAEAGRLARERLQVVVAEAANSAEIRQSVWHCASGVLADYLCSEQLRSRLTAEAREVVEACMREVTNQIMHGLNNRVPHPSQPGRQSAQIPEQLPQV